MNRRETRQFKKLIREGSGRVLHQGYGGPAQISLNFNRPLTDTEQDILSRGLKETLGARNIRMVPGG